MNVAKEFLKVGIFFNHYGSKTDLRQRTTPVMPTVVGNSISHEESLHLLRLAVRTASQQYLCVIRL
ncbi:MAG: hypothetical protein SV686_07090 [Thermodesulfobacteriota bacterium]|nr:hypothetical protein [Thermodesulfobacteriota bacterium]